MNIAQQVKEDYPRVHKLTSELAAVEPNYGSQSVMEVFHKLCTLAGFEKGKHFNFLEIFQGIEALEQFLKEKEKGHVSDTKGS